MKELAFCDARVPEEVWGMLTALLQDPTAKDYVHPEEAREERLILLRKKYTTHPGDRHLDAVLVWWHDKFVVWMENTQVGGFSYGDYLTLRGETMEDTFLDALNAFDQKGKHTTHTLRVMQDARYEARKAL